MEKPVGSMRPGLEGILRWCLHGPILSKVRTSRKLGAVHVPAWGVVFVVSAASLATSTFTGGAPHGKSHSMPCSPDSR